MGTLSLGGVIAACGGGGGGGGDEKATSTTSTTGAFDGAASCAVTPEQTEGPFYIDVDKVRSDIREDRPGALLRLGIRARGGADCKPLDNAVVDVWHCDALGGYSGVNGDAGTFLRGVQVTNGDGAVEFKTIYPGWYWDSCRRSCPARSPRRIAWWRVRIELLGPPGALPADC